MSSTETITLKVVIPSKECTKAFLTDIKKFGADMREFITITEKPIGFIFEYVGLVNYAFENILKRHLSKNTIEHIRNIAFHCHELRYNEVTGNIDTDNMSIIIQSLKEYAIYENFFTIQRIFLETEEEYDARLVKVIPWHVVLQHAHHIGRQFEVTDDTSFVFQKATCTFGRYINALPKRQRDALRAQINRINRNMNYIRELEIQTTNLVFGFGLPKNKTCK